MHSLEETIQLIEQKKFLSIAADEKALRKLPKGNWIGGSISYFMDTSGGLESTDRYFIHQIPEESPVEGTKIATYTVDNLKQIIEDEPENGFSWIIIPAFSTIHQKYAKEIPSMSGIYNKPLVGWISGIHLSELGKNSPKIVDGTTGEFSSDKAVVMHVPLPKNKAASIEILNLFTQGKGDTITFPEDGFLVDECFINGEKQNFSKYLKEQKTDLKLPLVADVYNVMVNTSIQSIDEAKNLVQLYAPVFRGVDYKIAGEIDNYSNQFQKVIPVEAQNNVFSCNCILNYLFGELEGKKTGSMTGPMTFGEIAYILLNQTLVYLEIRDI